MRGPTFFHWENACANDGKTSCHLCTYLFLFPNLVLETFYLRVFLSFVMTLFKWVLFLFCYTLY